MAVDLTYKVVRQYPWTIFLGGTQTQDAIAVGIVTNGHGVYVEFYIPTNVYSPTQVKDYSIGYTGTYEGLFELPGVTGVSWSQQPNKSGELVAHVTISVTSTSENSTGSITVLQKDLYSTATNAAIAELLTDLNTSEGLTS